MRSLKVLCADPSFPERQKKYFEAEVTALLAEGGMDKDGALFCLNRLACRYSVGGHSCGRSLRSCIQIRVSGWLDMGEDAKAKTALSILVAMHYDFEYINLHGWFDKYHLENVSWIPLDERVIVSAAAFALGVDAIPSLDDWDDARILAFLNEY